VIEGGVISFIRADHIGRPVFATNASGVKTWTATYTPFGGVHTSTGALPPNRFPGQWFQSESGLHQNWMRDYDPTTGRYLQADPLGLVDGASVYGYAGQSPMMNMDPTGQCFGPLIALAPACAGAVWGMAMYLAYEYVFDCGDWTWSGLFEAGVFGAVYGALGGPTGLGIGYRGAAGGAAAGGAASLADDLGRAGLGPFAGESVPARTAARDFTAAERDAINRIGQETGCHTCGTTTPGTKTGNFVPDHQPPSSVNPPGNPQNLYPHCLNCSRQQGLDLANLKKGSAQ
jgi:RHS repeat-associated protein